jgi:hypothetical protein
MLAFADGEIEIGQHQAFLAQQFDAAQAHDLRGILAFMLQVPLQLQSSRIAPDPLYAAPEARSMRPAHEQCYNFHR